MESLPQYWVSEQSAAKAPDGRKVWLSSRGWSHTSFAQATEVAQQRLRQLIERFGKGIAGPREEYYPRIALREQLLHQMYDGETLIAEVSRNRYGTDVLNTDVILIADVDFPLAAPPSAAAGQGKRSILSRLLGRSAAAPPMENSQAEAAALGTATAFAGNNADLGTHVYRTLAGLRIIVTGSGALPTSERALQIMSSLDTDPLYVTLCATHATYRARLTPKPWRAGHSALSAPWPPRGDFDTEHTSRWLIAYERKSAGYATCKRIASFGAPSTPVERRVMDLHDQRTLADTDYPLA